MMQAEGYYELFLLNLRTVLRRGGADGPPVGGPGLRYRGADGEQAGLWGERQAPAERPQNQSVDPKTAPASGRSGGAAGVPEPREFPVAVSVPGEGGHPHLSRCGAEAAPDHIAAGWVQEDQISRSAPPVCQAHDKKYNSEKQKTQATKMDLIAWVLCFLLLIYNK